VAKVIETNISFDDNDQIWDFQSRVIEIDNWESYVSEVKNTETVVRNSVIGEMIGNSVPRQSKVENFKHDDYHLSCDIYNCFNDKTKKFAYLAEE
jgi:hypothetical protein